MVDVIIEPQPTAPMAAPAASERSQARRETFAVLIRRPAFIIGNIVIIGWIITAVLGERITPYDPFNYFAAGHLPPSPEHLMGTDRLGRDVLSRVMVGSRDVLLFAPLAALLGVAAGTLLGLVMGYYRGTIDDVLSRIVEAFLALPVVLVALLTLVVLGTSPLVVVCVVGILFTPIVARTVRSAVLSERQLDYVVAAKLRGEIGLLHPVPGDLPERPRTDGRRDDGPLRLRDLHRSPRCRSSASGSSRRPPDWGLTVSQEYNNMISGAWWPTLFPALAIASTVVAVNLIADSLQSVLSE